MGSHGTGAIGAQAEAAARVQPTPENAASDTGLHHRLRIRTGQHTGGTAGLALGYLQANMAILPAEWAVEFARFCAANPRPCPVVGVSEIGDPRIPELGEDLDIRSDVPQYNIYREGGFDRTVPSIAEQWQSDFVAFALGCSYTFERAIMADGIPLRHIDEDRVVPMYRTSIETRPAGRFGGGTVVSMRPFSRENAARAAEITARFPYAHGAPVNIGDPAAIGIDNLEAPDWGEPVLPRDGEVPVFWACGVTPQVALEMAKPPVCITHRPGHMLITDILSDEEAERVTEVALEKLHKLGGQ